MSAASADKPNDEELRSIFLNTDDPVLTAVEVADKLGITQQAAYARLDQAEDRGDIRRKKVGARAVVWWLPGHELDSR